MSEVAKLFNEFEPISKEAWTEKAKIDLKGADFERKLVWRTDDSINIQPFYTAEDATGSETTAKIYKAFNKNENSDNARFWYNYREIIVADAKTANEEALDALENRGADAILFNLQGNDNVDFAALLKGIAPQHCGVSFKNTSSAKQTVEAYFGYLKAQGTDLASIHGFVENDPMANWTITGAEVNFAELAETVKLTAEAPYFYGITVQSAHLVNAGCNYTQELALTLNKVTDYIASLTNEGLDANTVIRNIRPILATSGNYFFEIAKFRAFRVLLMEIYGLYDTDIATDEIKIMSESSTWSKSLYDPYVNMLRDTTESMSAILGGVDAILDAPYDSSFQSPDGFSNRIALNVSNLLKEESYFDKVVDPSAGSYYIENLTNELLERALEGFRATETAGGFIAEFKAGNVQNAIAEVRNKKEAAIASRKKVYVGTNRYPNLLEDIAYTDTAAANNGAGVTLLPQQRAAKAFEDLRQTTQKHFEESGSKPKVHLACYGNLAMRKARATFAADFFGTAGFEVLPEAFYESSEEAAKDSAANDAEIVVICSSDQDYEEKAVEFAKTFKASNANKELVLAGYPAAILDELKDAGVDNFIHMKTNAVEMLTAFQNKLNMVK